IHALGSIARHAQHETVRLAAFDRVQDHAELLSIALNSEFKDPTVAAVDRISDRVELEQIAARAKNKSASKRARAIVREMDDRLAAEEKEARDAAAPPVVEPDPEEIARVAREQADRSREEA